MSKGSNNEHTKEQLPPKDYSWIFLIIATLLIVIIWSAYLVAAPRFWPLLHDSIRTNLPHGLFKGDKVDLGTLGDYFGALNCLFAGLAYASVVVSIKQQSNSIKLQHKELKAQLDEMENSVKEAKEQNILQREYQFSDEFYRRINLLKLIEKDIWFDKKSGQIAALKITSDLNTIVGHIRNGKLQEAEAMIVATDGTSLHEMLIGLDMFSIWTETFTNTVIWLQEYFCQELEIKTREASSISDTTLKEQIIANACNDLAKKQAHHEAVLLSSTFWASQFLLILQLYKNSNFHTIEALLKRYNFQNKAHPIPIPDKSYLDLCCKILNLTLDDHLTQQIQMIHDSHTSPKAES